ncbi:GDSL-type esterase/lipase family protein [Sphingomonas sp. LB-2]|uniref:SGNH/GDSL hydrolase family protein n=1 Tax=Sphingomonas caeni TaxID=2984949 RepID=UPI0022318F17|nr:SGNH/GDSL hydrolase family protein [Sphingomonas caeni]MCW3846301.1 GDSL-type esterase/lipase family protein [Sphingomonas caeni]
MRRLWMLGALALMAAAPASSPEMNVGGRVVKQADGGMRFGWPAIYFEQRFKGTGVVATVQTETEIFRLYVDGKDRGTIRPGALTLGVKGLPQGEHVVRLEKLTESQSGGAVFGGFKFDGVPLATPHRARRIEFIGDSHSAGYGNTSTSRTCTQKEIHDTTDTQQAFGPLVAKRFDADYRVNAYSGAGIVRNYNGVAPQQNLPVLYARAIPGEEASTANDAGWQPQLIVIKLGSNDFSTPLHAGEKWADQAALHADYRASYSRFLAMLIARHPKAHFLLMAHDPFIEDVRAVAAAAGRDIPVIRTVDMELTGCDWHPSLKDDRTVADQIEKAIGGIKGLWD